MSKENIDCNKKSDKKEKSDLTPHNNGSNSPTFVAMYLASRYGAKI